MKKLLNKILSLFSYHLAKNPKRTSKAKREKFLKEMNDEFPFARQPTGEKLWFNEILREWTIEGKTPSVIDQRIEKDIRKEM